jgi:hypothetical protein
MFTRRFRLLFALPFVCAALLLIPLAARAQNYQGTFDGGTCSSLTGWAWDGSTDNVVSVDVLDGTTLLQTVPANQFRSDLAPAGIGDGWHAWSLATPASVNDGQVHAIHVRPHGTSIELASSPKTLDCLYNGFFDVGNLTTLTGWAWQAGVDQLPVSIDIFDGATPILTGVPANRFRGDLPGAGIGDGFHAFSAGTPASVNDGQDHFIYTRIAGPEVDLQNSPKLLTPNPYPVYQGFLDAAGCGSLAGWAEDANHPGNALTVTFYDNGNLLGVTALANIFRQDLLAAGIGNGGYGFYVATPASLLDGATHNITAQIQGSGGFMLVGGPVSLNCPQAPVITGIYPTSGAAGSLVTINGLNFGPGTPTVIFSGMSTGAALSSWNSTSISAFVPAGATTGNIEVECSGGNGFSPVFTFVPQAAPIISYIVQPVPLYPGTWGTVQIYGSNFGSVPGNLNICPNGANPCILPDASYFPCNIGVATCTSFAFDVWQNNFIQARMLLSNGYEYYPVWQLAVQAAGALISTSLAAFEVSPPPNCAVPVKFSQVGLGQDKGNITYRTDPNDAKTDTGLPTVELAFSYQFESSTHQLSDLQGCFVGEIVSQPTAFDIFTPLSPPFPSNTYMSVNNPFHPRV